MLKNIIIGIIIILIYVGIMVVVEDDKYIVEVKWLKTPIIGYSLTPTYFTNNNYNINIIINDIKDIQLKSESWFPSDSLNNLDLLGRYIHISKIRYSDNTIKYSINELSLINLIKENNENR